MNAARFRKFADRACDLSVQQAEKIFFEITGWLSAEKDPQRRDMSDFRQFVADCITEELGERN